MSHQPPTCRSIRLRNVDDANRVFHGVFLRVLPLFSRRLTVEERRAIHTGCVFVWEERNPTMEATGEGIERWTDGRRWSCSRVKNDFLFYQEKLPDINDEALSAAMQPNRLVKQTYSVYVDTPEGRRKWHLVAYYTPETRDTLLTVDDIPELAALRYHVPPGAYLPARLARGRGRPEPDVEMQVPHLHTSHPHPRIQTELPMYTPSAPFAFQPSPILVPAVFDAPHEESSPDPPSSPELQTPPSSPPQVRPNPRFIIENAVAKVDIAQAEQRTLRSPGSSSNEIAPLVYSRYRPYKPRHPLDLDAIRAFDANFESPST